MPARMEKLNQLTRRISACDICANHLPLGPRPVVQLASQASLLIIGQAPGLRVHQSGIPWDDPSGDRLRSWLQIDRDTFYGPQVALLPMGFCYPGRGKSGDLPPRRECAPAWHDEVVSLLPQVRLTILIGNYAQRHYLPDCKPTLTATVQSFAEYLPQYLPLPHPSPRNNIWLKRNPWFDTELLPRLQGILRASVD